MLTLEKSAEKWPFVRPLRPPIMATGLVILSVCLSVRLSVCLQKQSADFAETWLWLGLPMTRTVEELINFDGDPVMDTDSGSFFHFRQHCGRWFQEIY